VRWCSNGITKRGEWDKFHVRPFRHRQKRGGPEKRNWMKGKEAAVKKNSLGADGFRM